MVLIPPSCLVAIMAAILSVAPVTALPSHANPRPGPLEDTTNPGAPPEGMMGDGQPSKPLTMWERIHGHRPSPSCESQYPPAFLTEYKCALEPDSTGWRLYDETDIPDRVVAGSSFTKATYALVRKIKPSRPCQIPSKGATVKGPIGRCYCTYGCTGITAPITAAAATP